jgi:hypothetical protein
MSATLLSLTDDIPSPTSSAGLDGDTSPSTSLVTPPGHYALIIIFLSSTVPRDSDKDKSGSRTDCKERKVNIRATWIQTYKNGVEPRTSETLHFVATPSVYPPPDMLRHLVEQFRRWETEVHLVVASFDSITAIAVAFEEMMRPFVTSLKIFELHVAVWETGAVSSYWRKFEMSALCSDPRRGRRQWLSRAPILSD